MDVEHQGEEGYGGEEEEEEDVDVEVEEVEEEEEEEEGSFGKIPRIIDHDNDNDNLVPDEDQQARYESEEEENVEAKIIKEKPVGPPMELEIPMRPPPAHPEMVSSFSHKSVLVVGF